MSFNWDAVGGGGKYLKIKEGETLDLTIKSIKKAEGQFNLKDKTGKDLGWHVQVDTDKGIISVTSWGLYFAFRDSGSQSGDKIQITFVKKGGLGKSSQYEIVVKEKGVSQGEAEEPTDEMPF
jgi:hypothetical protein